MLSKLASAALFLVIFSISNACLAELRCLSKNGAKRCWQIQAIKPILLEKNEIAPFSRVEIKELGIDEVSFVVSVRWVSSSSFGREEGLISFEGPNGVMFAVGHVTDGHVYIDDFSDQSFDQDFARAVAFGTTNQDEANKKTIAWLKKVLPDILAKKLTTSSSPDSKPLANP